MSWIVLHTTDVESIGNEVVTDTGTGLTYQLLRKLGGGGHGIAYAASAGDSESITHVIKEFRAANPGEIEKIREEVQREFYITEALRKMGGLPEMCKSYASCAQSMWFSGEGFKFRGFIMFPWHTEKTLRSFYWEERNKHPPDQPMPLDYQIRAFEIARDLCRAIHALNVLEVYHGDIKPANILYDAEERRIRMIDFGLGCTPRNSWISSIYNIPKMTTCDEKDAACYFTTYAYRDPRAGLYYTKQSKFNDWYGNYRPDGTHQGNVYYPKDFVKRLWPWFEEFAVAMSIYDLFAPLGFIESQFSPPKIKMLPTMPEEPAAKTQLVAFLQQMTGPIHNRRELATYADRFQLSLDLFLLEPAAPAPPKEEPLKKRPRQRKQ